MKKSILMTFAIILMVISCQKDKQLPENTYPDYWNDLINEVSKIPNKKEVQDQISQMGNYNRENFYKIVKSDKIVELAEKIIAMNNSDATAQDFIGETEDQILFKLNRLIYAPTKIEDSMRGKKASIISFGCYDTYKNATAYCRQESVAGAIVCGVTLEAPPLLVMCALAVLTRESICFHRAGDAYYDCIDKLHHN